MLRFSDNNNKLNTVALLGAFSMFLSTVEYLFPRPIPFMRLGLANLPLLLALDIFSGPYYVLLVILKVLGQGLVNGTLASYVFLFSLTGSVGSALVMYACHRGLKNRISFIGISLMGALASNAVQIILSITFIFGSSAWRILPLFLGIGLVSGLFIGIFAQFFSEKSVWWSAFKADALGKPFEKSQSDIFVPNEPAFFKKRIGFRKKRKTRKKKKDRLALFLHPSPRFWTGLALIPGYLFLDNLFLKFILVLFFAVLAGLAGKRLRFSYYVILVSSITFFHLLTPTGRIISVIGPLQITSGALAAGFTKGITLCGLIFISLFSVSGQLKLPGALGGLLARTFFYFEEILEGRKSISARNFTESLDRVLMEMFPPGEYGKFRIPESTEEEVSIRNLSGIAYSVILIIIVWGSFILQF